MFGQGSDRGDLARLIERMKERARESLDEEEKRRVGGAKGERRRTSKEAKGQEEVDRSRDVFAVIDEEMFKTCDLTAISQARLDSM